MSEPFQIAILFVVLILELVFLAPIIAIGLARQMNRRAYYERAIRLMDYAVKCSWIGTLMRSQAHLTRSLALICTTSPERAIGDCDQSLAVTSKRAPAFALEIAHAYALRSFAKELKNDIEGANADAQLSILVMPKSFLGYAALGNVLMAKNDYTEALENFNKALSLEMKEAELYTHRADCLSHLNREADAITDSGIAVALNPLLPHGYLNRANNNLRLGKLELAERDLEKVAQLDSNEYKLWQYRARIMFAKGQPSDALAHLDTYVKANPKNEKYFLILRGKICNALSRYEEAETYLNEALAIEPLSLEALWHHGDTMEKLGKTEFGLAKKLKAEAAGFILKP